MTVSDSLKGMPFRHVRNKAAMLLSFASADEMRAALLNLAYTMPDKVLGALCDVMDEKL